MDDFDETKGGYSASLRPRWASASVRPRIGAHLPPGRRGRPGSPPRWTFSLAGARMAGSLLMPAEAVCLRSRQVVGLVQ